jgi:hypothetical protein
MFLSTPNIPQERDALSFELRASICNYMYFYQAISCCNDTLSSLSEKAGMDGASPSSTEPRVNAAEEESVLSLNFKNLPKVYKALTSVDGNSRDKVNEQ